MAGVVGVVGLWAETEEDEEDAPMEDAPVGAVTTRVGELNTCCCFGWIGVGAAYSGIDAAICAMRRPSPLLRRSC